MARSDLVVIAAIAGAYGVRGEARVKPFGDPDALSAYGPFLDAHGAVIATPEAARRQGDFAVVRFREGFSREDVAAMKGTLLRVPRSALPEPEEDEYYHADLMGLRAESPEGEALGRVKAVLDHGAGDLLEIAPGAGAKTLLIPFTREHAPVVDLDAGLIVVVPLIEDEDEPG